MDTTTFSINDINSNNTTAYFNNSSIANLDIGGSVRIYELNFEGLSVSASIWKNNAVKRKSMSFYCKRHILRRKANDLTSEDIRWSHRNITTNLALQLT